MHELDLYGVMVALYGYSGLVAPRLSFCNVCCHLPRFVLCSGCVPCSFSTHRAPGKKATVPIYKVLVEPCQESNSLQTYQHRSGRTYYQATGWFAQARSN